MTKYIVTGYERIFVMMTVEADSEEEAIEKAKDRPKWEVREE